jgi:hypothetical protein
MKIYFFSTLFLVLMSISLTHYFKLAKLEFFMKQDGEKIIEMRKNKSFSSISTKTRIISSLIKNNKSIRKSPTAPVALLIGEQKCG